MVLAQSTAGPLLLVGSSLRRAKTHFPDMLSPLVAARLHFSPLDLGFASRLRCYYGCHIPAVLLRALPVGHQFVSFPSSRLLSPSSYFAPSLCYPGRHSNVFSTFAIFLCLSLCLSALRSQLSLCRAPQRQLFQWCKCSALHVHICSFTSALLPHIFTACCRLNCSHTTLLSSFSLAVPVSVGLSSGVLL